MAWSAIASVTLRLDFPPFQTNAAGCGTGVYIPVYPKFVAISYLNQHFLLDGETSLPCEPHLRREQVSSAGID